MKLACRTRMKMRIASGVALLLAAFAPALWAQPAEAPCAQAAAGLSYGAAAAQRART
jgi:hypothetical protein